MMENLNTEPPEPNKPKPLASHSNERIITLSDGVFAIVITLLVLEIKVPEIEPNLVAQQLPIAINHLLPKIIAHIISFVVLGIYWIGHHNSFMHIKRHDRMLLWLNILFLMCVASMPFPTGLISQYPEEQISVVIYAGTLVLAGLAMDLMWWYATTHNLVDEDTDPKFVAFVHRRNLTPPIAYSIAILISFFSLSLAKFLFIAVAAYYIVPNPLDRKHYKQLARRFNQ